MLPSDTPDEQDAVPSHFAHLVDAATLLTKRLPSSIVDALTPSGDYPYDELTRRTAALRHQSESLLQAVGRKDYVFHAGGSEIERLLRAIVKRVRNRKAWKKFGMVDPFAQSLKNRKIRTFQDALLKICDDMSQEAERMQAGLGAAERMQAGWVGDSDRIVRPPNCDRTAA